MTKDKQILYIVSSTILAVLLILLFVNVENSRLATACLLLPLTAATLLIIKKRGALSINKKEVLLLSIIVGVLYVSLLQITGLFFGFYHNPYMMKLSNVESLVTSFLPAAAIIACSELIRRVLLAQRNAYASVAAYLICVLAETLSCSTLAGIRNFNGFMDLFGMTLFPALCANIYYQFASKRYGAYPNMALRFITTLYVYFIPSTTAMADAISSILKLVFPVIMYALVSALFEKKKKTALKKSSKLSSLATALTAVLVVAIGMLISCQFRFGALVIATESMTGEINKGDMVIYEQYDDQKIEVGQVIVFSQNDARIVHRVVSIQTIGGETRYYTKGDANENDDAGYRTEANIVGLTDLKIAYAGYPTLWLRELLEGSH